MRKWIVFTKPHIEYGLGWSCKIYNKGQEPIVGLIIHREPKHPGVAQLTVFTSTGRIITQPEHYITSAWKDDNMELTLKAMLEEIQSIQVQVQTKPDDGERLMNDFLLSHNNLALAVLEHQIIEWLNG